MTNARPSQGASQVRPNVTYRAPHEFYPTQPAAVRALLEVETFEGPIWEPACGKGAISDVLVGQGYTVYSTDLVDYGYGEAGVDFLQTTQQRGRSIITNPPYGRGLADRFLRKALHYIDERQGGQVAMLLNIASLCHPTRHGSFKIRPPRTLYFLDRCVCYPNGEEARATPKTYEHRYCWAIWDTHGPTACEARWLRVTQQAKQL